MIRRSFVNFFQVASLLLLLCLVTGLAGCAQKVAYGISPEAIKMGLSTKPIPPAVLAAHHAHYLSLKRPPVKARKVVKNLTPAVP